MNKLTFITQESATVLFNNDVEVFGEYNDGSESQIDDLNDFDRFDTFFIETEKFKVNVYNIRFNEMFDSWQVSHEETGSADFNKIDDAIDYADRG